MINFNELPEKTQKQLSEFIKDKIIIEYVESSRIHSHTYPFGANYTYAAAATVYKRTRPAEVYDIFRIRSIEEKDKQEYLRRIFDLEKKVEELEKLKESIVNIKEFIK